MTIRSFKQWAEQEHDWDADDDQMKAHQEKTWKILQLLTKELSSWSGHNYSVAVDSTAGYDDPLSADSFILYINQEEIMQGDLDEIHQRLKQIAKEEGM